MLSVKQVIKIIEGLLQSSCPQTVLHKDGFAQKSHPHTELQLSLLQLCDDCGYHKNTKFLAKTLFDMAMMSSSNLKPENANLYALSAFSIAVKFNQSQETVEQLTLRDLSKMADERFSEKEFIEAQMDILELSQFSLHITSPYDYISHLDFCSRNSEEETRSEEIESIIDFAITLPKLTHVSPKLIFLACFRLVFDSCLSSTNGRLLRRKLRKQLNKGVCWSYWEKVQKMAIYIQKNIEKLSKAAAQKEQAD